MKSKLDNISDEDLAAYIDGVASEDEANAILDSIQTKEDLELFVLALSSKETADKIFSEEDTVNFGEQPTKKIILRPFESLPMAGFLGEEKDQDDIEEKNDNE